MREFAMMRNQNMQKTWNLNKIYGSQWSSTDQKPRFQTIHMSVESSSKQFLQQTGRNVYVRTPGVVLKKYNCWKYELINIVGWRKMWLLLLFGSEFLFLW